MKEYPVIHHCLLVGKQGTYKDVTGVMFCSNSVEDGAKVFANQVLTFPHEYVGSLAKLKEIRGDVWNPAILYIHDAGSVFNSRDWMKVKDGVTDTRKIAVNNWRKRGIQFLGTVHRESEIDIDIRLLISYFMYPKVYRFGSDNIEDFVIELEIFDEPVEIRDREAEPIRTVRFRKVDKYCLMYDTLAENEGFKRV